MPKVRGVQLAIRPEGKKCAYITPNQFYRNVLGWVFPVRTGRL